MKIQPATGSFARNLIYSTKPVCANFHWFLPREDAQDKLAKWRREYNHDREHSSLNDTTLAEFIRSLRKDEEL
ncbi:integrase core domain-containing protein [Klebsiella pneumoniae]|uniref:integrase core domain-containing protein n=1 Tax=Klebsiella pneumoniae TaxID=573 RepID=UPI0009B947F5|nr:integrase core domain-containing protein [Klebsiella pneumoniae]